MKTRLFRRTLIAAALAAAVIGSAGVLAQDPQPVANSIVVRETATMVTFAGDDAKSGGILKVRIDGPDGANVFEASSKSGLVDWVLEANLPEGHYNYDVWFTPATTTVKASGSRPETRYHSGSFVIKGGMINSGSTGESIRQRKLSAVEAPSLYERAIYSVLKLLTPTAMAADLTASDGDYFGAEVFFNHSVNSVTTDFEIFVIAGDGTTDDVFYLDDEFTTDLVGLLGIQEGAPNNSLFIETSGNIGLGTSTPDAELHITNSEANLILESTFITPHAWQLTTGILGNFRFADRDTGSWPFYIFDGAPSYSLTVGKDIGMGTSSPAAALHVSRDDGSAKLLVENDSTTTLARGMFELRNNGGPSFVLKDTHADESYSFAMSTTGNFIISQQQNPGDEMRLEADGDVFFQGDVTANGVLLTSSRALKTGFTDVDEATLLAKVAELDISQWRYKSEPETAQHIGPMAEQFQAVFGLGDGKHLEMVDTTGIAFAAIQALEAENQALMEKVAGMDALQVRLDAMLARLDALEARQ